MKIISLELLVHFKDLLVSGKLIPYQSKTLSQKLSVDKLPDGVPTQVIEVLQESKSPATSSAIIKAIDEAIRKFSSSLGTVSSKLILSIEEHFMSTILLRLWNLDLKNLQQLKQDLS